MPSSTRLARLGSTGRHMSTCNLDEARGLDVDRAEATLMQRERQTDLRARLVDRMQELVAHQARAGPWRTPAPSAGAGPCGGSRRRPGRDRWWRRDRTEEALVDVEPLLHGPVVRRDRQLGGAIDVVHQRDPEHAPAAEDRVLDPDGGRGGRRRGDVGLSPACPHPEESCRGGTPQPRGGASGRSTGGP